ncbi:flavin reductase family protein [Amaricoccus solimangrovi]|uniref:Flavin reductase family protein n=1 Tax=Amaricoccus solimangrovi TaxID=2589815 RepID=A0A501WD67_9RHOB|nr:flavin reductase family protein [Amaricoccus solimangrovi]TPE46772.1 flavin reductase family protein [Amaricoccus solimangrovi]
MTETLDPRALRGAFGAFLTGVTVVTTTDAEGNPIGFTANSFTSVSLDPPLLLVCLAKRSYNYATVTGAGGFAINILAEDQEGVSNTFARPSDDRFAGIDWSASPNGAPIIRGAAAWFDCATHEIVEAGDHAVLIGRVRAFEDAGANGLGYARGAYVKPGTLGAAVAAAAEGAARVGAVVERDGAILLLGGEDGPLTLPEAPIETTNSPAALRAFLLARIGLPTHVGFVYSVYEDRARGWQHIVYRCDAGFGAPSEGRFVPLTEIPYDRIADGPTRDVVRRFAAESALGNFGVYFGNETRGRVHPLDGKA